jgi:hypothetical protein
MVYFLKNPKSGLIKIGWSSFVPTRVLHLKSMYGHHLILLKCIEGDRKTERRLHKRFRKSRVFSEWFKESRRLSHFIKTSKRAHQYYEAYYLPMPSELADFLRELAAREYRTTSAQVQVIIESWLKTLGKAGADPNAG